MPFTLGVSGIGVGLASASIHNARKKREIIDKYLTHQGAKHQTRKRDVLTPMAISGTVGVVTLGVGSAAADAITNQAAEHAFTTIAENELAVKVTTHLALDAAVMKGEEEHMKNKKAQENLKAERKASLQQGVPTVNLPGVDIVIPSAVDPQHLPLKPFRPSTESSEQPEGLQAKFSQLSVNSSNLEPSSPGTPLPVYAPTPAIFANDTKAPDGVTLYLPPPPPNVRQLSASSVSFNGWTAGNSSSFSRQEARQPMPGSVSLGTTPSWNFPSPQSSPAPSKRGSVTYSGQHITSFDHNQLPVTSTVMGLPTPLSTPAEPHYNEAKYSQSYFPPPPSSIPAPIQSYVPSTGAVWRQNIPVSPGSDQSYTPYRAQQPLLPMPIPPPTELSRQSLNISPNYFPAPQQKQIPWQHPPTPPMYFPPPLRNI